MICIQPGAARTACQELLPKFPARFQVERDEELAALNAEAEMPIEDLLAMYRALAAQDADASSSEDGESVPQFDTTPRLLNGVCCSVSEVLEADLQKRNSIQDRLRVHAHLDLHFYLS